MLASIMSLELSLPNATELLTVVNEAIWVKFKFLGINRPTLALGGAAKFSKFLGYLIFFLGIGGS